MTSTNRSLTALSRRQVLAGGAGLVAASFWPGLATAANPEVIVIGAGAAGIAAARKLLSAGRRVTVIEAGNCIGGRLKTDRAAFGVPFDVGAHWLHSRRQNPFVDHGLANGFTLYPAPDEERLFVGGRPAKKSEIRDYDRALARATAALEQAGERGRDVSAASVMPTLGKWGDTVRHALGPYEMGKDLENFSCADWYTGLGGRDWYCREGFGTLWAHSAGGVPVQLSTTAKRVRWGGRGVVVETDRGDLKAKACIVTVSTGVLASGRLRFDPALPADKQESFNGISMGLYNHIALQFKKNFFGIGDDGYVSYQVRAGKKEAPKALSFLTNISGTNLTLGDVGGSFAWELEKAGSAAAIDFALGELRKMYGGQVKRAFIKARVTSWGQNPFTRGSYASAEPGAFALRRVLRRPVAKRIWFAGEACSAEQWATVAGAHKNGDAVANRVLRNLKR
ncbi:MAG: NAD(P)/FAD-dependent oxidoreductase [Pseudomonadota bacterium]